VAELRTNFSKILDQIVLDRQPVLISHKGKVLAKLIHYLDEDATPLSDGPGLSKKKRSREHH
jgi:antitoxin (DNA-binding transcriptional repressor) of toxin-antitoxin stability system